LDDLDSLTHQVQVQVKPS